MDPRTFQSLQANQLKDKDAENKINQLFRYASALAASVSSEVALQITNYAAARPTFSAHKNGTTQFSLSSGVSMQITFSTEEWDVGGYFASSAFTPPAGKYRLSACVTWAASNGVDNELLALEFRKNGSVIKEMVDRRAGTGAAATEASILVSANGTDTFEIYGLKAGAGNGDVLGAASDTYFQGEAIS